MDPFTSHNTVVLFCDILDAIKKDPYERDPRGTANMFYFRKTLAL